MTLHITNGDHAAGKLRRVVEGTVITTCDVLHEGPAPRVDDRAWYDLRARYLADHGPDVASIRESLAASDRAIVEACAHGDDIVLWFEHDLYDQLLPSHAHPSVRPSPPPRRTAIPAVS